MSGTTPRRGLRTRIAATSVRARILSVVVLLAALSLAAAGLTAHTLQVRVVDARIASDLRASYSEFQHLASDGRDPSTGDAFTSPRALTAVPAAVVSVMIRSSPAPPRGAPAGSGPVSTGRWTTGRRSPESEPCSADDVSVLQNPSS